MRTKIFKGIGIIFAVVFCLASGIALLQLTDQNAHSYSGYYEAESLSDVYAYQQTVNEAALEVDAAILESNIMITSPPRYTFRVVMPDDTPFEYGKVLPFGVRFWYVFGFVAVGGCLVVMVRLIMVILRGPR